MSESLAYPTHPGANLIVGASSPLWAYFASAAATGVALWWMSRWARTDGLQALVAAPPAPMIPEPAAEAPFVSAAEAVMSEASGDAEAAAEAQAPTEADAAPAANDVEPSEAKTA